MENDENTKATRPLPIHRVHVADDSTGIIALKN
jgi:hypothetical protein